MSLKKIFVAIFFLISAYTGYAQILRPAKWTTSISSQNLKEGDEAELIFKATIDKEKKPTRANK